MSYYVGLDLLDDSFKFVKQSVGVSDCVLFIYNKCTMYIKVCLLQHINI